MLCGEASLVNRGDGGIRAVSMACRAWTCPDCAEWRRKQLVALAISGNPNTFVTITVNPAWGADKFARARALVDAWRVAVRLWKAKHPGESLPYLCVFEAQKSGEPHLHILCRASWIKKRWLSDLMKSLLDAPIVDVQRVHNKKKLAFYVAKYIGKDPHRFETCKRYWTTQDWELVKYERPASTCRWHSKWTLERTPLAELAAEWRDQGRTVETSSRYIQSTWRGGTQDQWDAVDEIYRKRERGQPW